MEQLFISFALEKIITLHTILYLPMLSPLDATVDFGTGHLKYHVIKTNLSLTMQHP